MHRDKKLRRLSHSGCKELLTNNLHEKTWRAGCKSFRKSDFSRSWNRASREGCNLWPRLLTFNWWDSDKLKVLFSHAFIKGLLILNTYWRSNLSYTIIIKLWVNLSTLSKSIQPSKGNKPLCKNRDWLRSCDVLCSFGIPPTWRPKFTENPSSTSRRGDLCVTSKLGGNTPSHRDMRGRENSRLFNSETPRLRSLCSLPYRLCLNGARTCTWSTPMTSSGSKRKLTIDRWFSHHSFKSCPRRSGWGRLTRESNRSTER